MNVKSPTGTTMYLHQDGDWTQPCVATLAQVGTGVDMTCILEAQELDLYFNGVNLVWQGPQLQCNYVKMTPYSFYQFQPGIGPTTVTATQVVGSPPVITGTTGGTTGAFVNSSGAIECDADYSGTSPVAGPNCCEGTYTYNLTVGAGPATTTTVSWGGNASNCLAGPAMASQPKDPAGFPEPSIFFLAGGTVNSSYAVAAPISKPNGSNAGVANYFCPGGICPILGNVVPNAATSGSTIVPGIPTGDAPALPEVGGIIEGTTGYALQNAPAAMQFGPAAGTTGATVAGVNSITNIASTAAVTYDNIGGSINVAAAVAAAVPVFVFGPGIIPGTTVTATTLNTVTLSQNAELTLPAGVGATFTFSFGVFPAGQPWYEFDCMDNAEDYVARLRVLVRSWTTANAFNAAMALNGVAVGANPFVCGPEALFPDQPLYDRNIWPSCTSNGQTFGFANNFPEFGL